MFLQKKNIFKHLHSLLRLSALLVPVMVAGFASAQRIVTDGIDITESSKSSMAFSFYVGDFHFDTLPNGFCNIALKAANGYTHDVGLPSLPIYQQVIRIPDMGSPTVSILEQKWTSHSLYEWGIASPVLPASAPRAKSHDTPPVVIDSECYNTDTFYHLPLVQITPIGSLHGKRLVRLTVAPVSYNPVSRQLRLCHSVSIHIDFNGDTFKQPKSLLSQEAPTFMVVAPERFRQTLQPFIRWKREEGFLVEEHYILSADRIQIKSFLQRRHDIATPTMPAPQFILLVGDVEDIPAWPATQYISGIPSHQTDLYYGEFSGDYLPDAIVGRISVEDSSQLQAVLEKTIAYEKFTIADSSHLRHSLLVAGKELTPPAPTVTNGQVNYIKSQLLLTDTLHDTACYYNPTSYTLANSIHAVINDGIGLVNYTAHCQSNGWRNPDFTNTDADSLPSNGHYFLSVNNCCRANDFMADCLGEHLLRKRGGGAIGVIGATNETLWNEDFYWSVGNREPVLFPTYDSETAGAFDCLLNIHQGATAIHAETQGGMMQAGNMAVTRSDSPYDAFYWEIYNLLGDPSLMPYIGIPGFLQISIPQLQLGDIEVPLHGTPLTRVAATSGDSLLGYCTLDSDGNATMRLTRPMLDTLLFTATRQFHRPLQVTASPMPSPTPRMVVRSASLTSLSGTPISRLTLRDTALLHITLHNTGTDSIHSHRLTISSNNSGVLWTNDTLFTVASLAPRDDTNIVVVLLALRDSTQAALQLATGDSNLYWQQRKPIDILKPRLAIASVQLLKDDLPTLSITPSDSYSLQATLHNTGLGLATGIIATLDDTLPIHVPPIPSDSTAILNFTITLPDTLSSLPVSLKVECQADTATWSGCYPATTAYESFEAGDFSHYNWLHGGDTPWVIDSTVSHSGHRCAASGHISDKQQSLLCLSLTVNQRDSLDFWVLSSTQAGHDKLQLLIDNNIIAQWSDIKDWRHYHCMVNDGNHLIQWRYIKDDSLSAGDDRVWIDDIRLPFGAHTGTSVGYGDSVWVAVTQSDAGQPRYFQLFPNPATDYFVLSGAEQPAQVVIYDIYGRVCDSFSVEPNSMARHDIRQLPCGIYTVLFITGQKQTTTRKLVIKR